MTEQQILDKTIEYLNKYSSFFHGWSYLESFDEIVVCDNNCQKRYCLPDIKECLNGGLDINASEGNYSRIRLVIYSEFRIAYNIIKDLAQHGTDNQINALG